MQQSKQWVMGSDPVKNLFILLVSFLLLQVFWRIKDFQDLSFSFMVVEGRRILNPLYFT